MEFNMPQENLKLISVRIDPETLKKIDLLVDKHTYWKRNTIINAILTSVVDNFQDPDIYDMLRWNRIHKDEVSCKFGIIKKPLPY